MSASIRPVWGYLWGCRRKHGKSLRPTLLNKGVETQSRGGYTVAEYTSIVAALHTWHWKTDKAHAKATRKVLHNYVLFLANTGTRWSFFSAS